MSTLMQFVLSLEWPLPSAKQTYDCALILTLGDFNCFWRLGRQCPNLSSSTRPSHSNCITRFVGPLPIDSSSLLVQRLLSSKQAPPQQSHTPPVALYYWLVGLFNITIGIYKHLLPTSPTNSQIFLMDCLVLPVTLIRRRSTNSRLGYRPLAHGGFDEPGGPVTVVVGKEKRVFLVEPFVLQEYPFRLLMETMTDLRGGVIFVDVDAILFEHMLWLLHNDSSSLFDLNLKEIIDFYAQEDC